MCKNVHEEYYRTLINEIKELTRWRDTPCSWIKRLNNVKDVSSSQLDLQIQCKMNVKCKTTKFLKENIVET